MFAFLLIVFNFKKIDFQKTYKKLSPSAHLIWACSFRISHLGMPCDTEI